MAADLEERTAQAEQSVEEMHALIDERKQAEEALRSSDERFRLAMQTAAKGTWDVGFVTDVHPTEARARLDRRSS